MGHEEGAQAIPLDQELNQMSRRELQDLAKVLGVKANTKSKVIIEKIGAMRGKVNEEECVEAAKELNEVVDGGGGANASAQMAPKTPGDSVSLAQPEGSNQMGKQEILSMVERRAKRKRDWDYAKESGRWEGSAKSKFQSMTDRWKVINVQLGERKQIPSKAATSGKKESEKGLSDPQKSKFKKQKENTVQEGGNSGSRIIKRRKLGTARPGKPRPGNAPLAERNLSSKTTAVKRVGRIDHKRQN